MYDPDHHPEFEHYAQCTQCDDKIKIKHGPSGIKKHFQYKHLELYNKELNQNDKTKVTTSCFQE